ncbi:helix-turn-helix domain-containing protein [Solirubrobacter phytolaccae]|uniref:Helix-turn-helix domain-containing protein n=1 Tax=Solirubrobacter phytolaccae TaxID=1404360 RepID=A0A9X3S972_9ACTN|nr:helix-turn-helix domain-containing protein [Solirubrobacter phytolaccae]MDA0178940.1 helix-turn-helix domain-containing protein [Solirubrobacter phytolaccae]
MTTDLAGNLRTWRDRLTPAEPGRRRAPGLRRDEIAARADVSVGYLTRLEQGHAAHPSSLVCGALARALELNLEETELLYRLAGHAPPSAERFSRELTPAAQRLLDRFDDLPVMVYDPAWEVVATNARGEWLIGPTYGNIARRHFLGPGTYIQHTPDQQHAMSASIVSDLHHSLTRFPADERLHAIVDELRRESPRFAELWEERPAAVHSSATKLVEHPVAGSFTLECDVLRVEGSDLRIVVYSAAPGTPDAEAISRFGAAEAVLSR